jgi:L-iditol 2-dehydrogenase
MMSVMKALVLEEYDKLVYKEVPVPDIARDEVLVRVEACGICGSDVHGMDGSTGRRIPPVIMGHEASGVIERAGRDIKKWRPGDRVTFDSTIYPLDDWFSLRGAYNLSDNRMVLGVSCKEFHRNGAFAEYVAIPGHILTGVPDGVSFEQAAMLEPIGVALHAVRLTPIDVDDSVIVFGAGMIGLFLIQVLRSTGSGQIIAVDIENEKLALAKELGATVALNPSDCDLQKEVLELTETRGADVAFEAIGIPQTVNAAVTCVRKGATVTLVGNLTPVVELPLQMVVSRQIRLQGSCAICGEFPTALAMIADGRIVVERIISATAPLKDGAEWFRRLHQKEKGLMKVILKP